MTLRGNNCEHCMDFYQDVPWNPATGKLKNECKKCNCNEHTDKCHFDSRVFAVRTYIFDEFFSNSDKLFILGKWPDQRGSVR